MANNGSWRTFQDRQDRDYLNSRIDRHIFQQLYRVNPTEGRSGEIELGFHPIRSKCSDRAEPRGEYWRSQQFICQTSRGTSVYHQCDMPRHHVCSQLTCIVYGESQPVAHHSAQAHSQISIWYTLSWHSIQGATLLAQLLPWLFGCSISKPGQSKVHLRICISSQERSDYLEFQAANLASIIIRQS